MHKIAGEFSCRFKIKISKSIFCGEYADTLNFRHSSMTNMLLNQSALAAEAVCRLFEYCFTILQILTYVLALITLSWKLTLLVGLFAIIQLVSMNKSGSGAKQLGEDLVNLGDNLSHLAHDYILGLKFLKVLKANDQGFKNVVKVSEAYRDTYVKRDQKRLKIDGIQETINNSLIFLILWFSTIVMIPLEKLLLFIFLLTRMIPTFKSFNNLNINIKSTYPAFEKIMKFSEKIKISNNHNPISDESNLELIQLQDISFSYDKKNYIFDKFSCSFKVGEITAIIGESGAGKTTLLDLTLGLLKPIQGEVKAILKNNLDVGLDRISVFYLPQKPIVFSGTIRSYFKMFIKKEDVLDSKIIAALNHVNLWDHFHMLQGLDTYIDESGSNISEGQKQRLCLANVFLNSYSVIILDEFTSAIDAVSKNIILNQVKKLTNSIVIFITHDKDTAKIANKEITLTKKCVIRE